MSTSLLYHASVLKGIRHKSTHFKSDAVISRAEMTDALVRCPHCGRSKAAFKVQKTRWFFMSPVDERKACWFSIFIA